MFKFITVEREIYSDDSDREDFDKQKYTKENQNIENAFEKILETF